MAAREGGSFITTISSSDIKEFRYTTGTSLPVMSEVNVPLFCKRIIRLLTLLKGGWLMLPRKYMVMRQDPSNRCPWLQAVFEMMVLLLLKLPETLYSLLEDGVATAVRMTGLSHLTWMLFNR